MSDPPVHPNAGGEPTPTATTSETARRAPTDRSSADDAFHKAIEGIPVAGATLVFVVKKWGLTGLLLFFSGGAFVLGLVYFGVVPGGLVSDKYRDAAPASIPAPPKGTALRGSLPLEIAAAESGWLHALIDLYRREGADAQEAEPGKRSSVDAVAYTIQGATNPFAWGLSTQSNFEVTAMAFRVTRDGASGTELVEQLKSEEGGTRSLKFSVPECREGDRLIAVVRVWSTDSPPPEDVRFVLRSEVK